MLTRATYFYIVTFYKGQDICVTVWNRDSRVDCVTDAVGMYALYLKYILLRNNFTIYKRKQNKQYMIFAQKSI